MGKVATKQPDWNAFIRWHVARFNQGRAKGMVIHDTLEFPIQWDRSIPLLEHLFYTFKYYVEEVSEFSATHDPKVNIDEVKEVCNRVLRAYKYALSWNTGAAMNELNCDVVNKLLQATFVEIEVGTKLYRLRGDRENLRGNNDFMHVPFNKIFLCSSMRFSMSGQPCLYLGYSKDVCYKELGIDSGGSIGQFRVKGGLNVVDLTLLKQNNKKVDMFTFWPILAACYVAPDNRDANFKEEYIFPQVIMQYIKNMGAGGIRYYTCREPNLDPQKTDYMNIALYARTGDCDPENLDIDKEYPFGLTSLYDEDLANRLEFIE